MPASNVLDKSQTIAGFIENSLSLIDELQEAFDEAIQERHSIISKESGTLNAIGYIDVAKLIQSDFGIFTGVVELASVELENLKYLYGRLIDFRDKQLAQVEEENVGLITATVPEVVAAPVVPPQASASISKSI